MIAIHNFESMYYECASNLLLLHMYYKSPFGRGGKGIRKYMSKDPHDATIKANFLPWNSKLAKKEKKFHIFFYGIKSHVWRGVEILLVFALCLYVEKIQKIALNMYIYLSALLMLFLYS